MKISITWSLTTKNTWEKKNMFVESLFIKET